MSLISRAFAMAEDAGPELASLFGTRDARASMQPQPKEALAVEAVADKLSRSESTSIHDLATLVAGMRDGNERALEQLYDATVGRLYAIAFAILRNAEDTEEVVCETYAYAWANAGRYDVARGNALGWLLMLCRSRAIDTLRHRRALATEVVAAELEKQQGEHDQPEDVLQLMQERSNIYAALSALSPERRRLVSLAFLQGLSHQQIAQVTGLPLGTIKSHLRRSLAQLRTVLEAK
jgi:RNA polymerase sigma factor (sigma-70 family)